MEFIKGIEELLIERGARLSLGRGASSSSRAHDENDRADGSDSDDDDFDDLLESGPDSREPSSSAAPGRSLSSRPVPAAPELRLSGPPNPWAFLDHPDSFVSSAAPEPPPRGHLVIHADMEGANVARAVPSASGTEYELHLRADTLSPKHRLWFYFGVSNALSDQRVLFTIVNFSKARAQYRDGMSPVVRSRSRPTWQRLPPRNVFYYKSPRHKAPYVLSFAFAFDVEDDIYEFAFCYPYSYTELQSDLAALRGQSLAHVRVEILTRSAQLRRVDVVTVSDAAAEARDAEQKRRRPVVCITARVHPGETPGSWAMKSLIQFLASSHPNAVALRRHVTFALVPMLNPDGVALGNYRTDSTGVDLNRQWSRCVATLEPSCHALLELLRKIDASPMHSLDLFMDLHAHSSAKVHFCLCNSFDASSPMEAERNTMLLRLMEANVLGFSFHNCVFDNEPSKEGCARRVVASTFPRTLAYTLELAFHVTRSTPYDDVIMAGAPQPPQQGYFGPSVTYTMSLCPPASVALPYYNAVASSILTSYQPACSYINQPGSGGGGRGPRASGGQQHLPPGFVLDSNSEAGYAEIGRGLAVSIGHYFDLKMAPMKSGIVHAGIRQLQAQQGKPGWNSSSNVGVLPAPAAQGRTSYAGKKKSNPGGASDPAARVGPAVQNFSAADLFRSSIAQQAEDAEGAAPRPVVHDAFPGRQLHTDGGLAAGMGPIPPTGFASLDEAIRRRLAAAAADAAGDNELIGGLGTAADARVSRPTNKAGSVTAAISGPSPPPDSPAGPSGPQGSGQPARSPASFSNSSSGPSSRQVANAMPNTAQVGTLGTGSLLDRSGRFRSTGGLLSSSGRDWEGPMQHGTPLGAATPPTAGPGAFEWLSEDRPQPGVPAGPAPTRGPLVKGLTTALNPAPTPPKPSLLAKPLRRTDKRPSRTREEAYSEAVQPPVSVSVSISGSGAHDSSAVDIASPSPAPSPGPLAPETSFGSSRLGVGIPTSGVVTPGSNGKRLPTSPWHQGQPEPPASAASSRAPLGRFSSQGATMRPYQDPASVAELALIPSRHDTVGPRPGSAVLHPRNPLRAGQPGPGGSPAPSTSGSGAAAQGRDAMDASSTDGLALVFSPHRDKERAREEREREREPRNGAESSQHGHDRPSMARPHLSSGSSGAARALNQPSGSEDEASNPLNSSSSTLGGSIASPVLGLPWAGVAADRAAAVNLSVSGRNLPVAHRSSTQGLPGVGGASGAEGAYASPRVGGEGPQGSSPNPTPPPVGRVTPAMRRSSTGALNQLQAPSVAPRDSTGTITMGLARIPSHTHDRPHRMGGGFKAQASSGTTYGPAGSSASGSASPTDVLSRASSGRERAISIGPGAASSPRPPPGASGLRWEAQAGGRRLERNSSEGAGTPPPPQPSGPSWSERDAAGGESGGRTSRSSNRGERGAGDGSSSARDRFEVALPFPGPG